MLSLAALALSPGDISLALVAVTSLVVGLWMAIPAIISAASSIAGAAASKPKSSGGGLSYLPTYSNVLGYDRDRAYDQSDSVLGTIGAQGEALNNPYVDAAREQQLQSRGQYGDALQALQRRANGEDLYSTAAAQVERDKAMANYSSQLATASGQGYYSPAAMRQTQRSASGFQQAMAGQNALMSAQERAAAQQALINGLFNQRAQDLASMDPELQRERQQQAFYLGGQQAAQGWSGQGLQASMAKDASARDMERLNAGLHESAAARQAGNDAAYNAWTKDMATGVGNSVSSIAGVLGGMGGGGGGGGGAGAYAGALDAAAKAGGSAAGAAAGGSWDPNCDVRGKTALANGAPAAEQFLQALQPYTYQFKEANLGAPGEHLGVMTQDMQKGGSLGTAVVKTKANGRQQIDVREALPAILAALGHLNQKVDAQAPAAAASPAAKQHSPQWQPLATWDSGKTHAPGKKPLGGGRQFQIGWDPAAARFPWQGSSSRQLVEGDLTGGQDPAQAQLAALMQGR